MLLCRKLKSRGASSARVVLLTSAALMLTLSAAPAMAANSPKQLTLTQLSDKVQELSGKVQELSDKAQIEDMINDWYKLGLLLKKDVDYAAYFTEDGVMDLNGRVTKGAKDIQAFFAPRQPAAVYCIYATNFNIVVNGDTATSENIYLVTMGDSATDNAKAIGKGIEHDQLVKRNGRWIFKRREIRRV